MPSWNTHLEAGSRLANKLRLSGSKRQEFLLGCILPDINNGYINRVGIKKHHHETHYAYNDKSTKNFYANNKAEIDRKNPVFLGYLFHLYTDGYFNHTFYREIKKSPLGEKLPNDEWRDIKHHDFWLYDTKFKHCLDTKKTDLKKLAEHANKIDVVEITPSDIENVEAVLTDENFNKHIKNSGYVFYSEKRLDDLLDETINSFIRDYLGGKHA
ncbi:hypothetical protein IKF92_01995 [Candidatus Saccharibacteria bacterium]|nr:hypothetical protein [Candidatus Saccharibacteria bacterium]